MANSEMANANFVAFSLQIPEDKLDIVARHLNATVRRFVNHAFQSRELNQEERLVKFFHQVSGVTNRHTADYTAEGHFTQMVKNWVNKDSPSKTLLLETYFFFHCRPEGKFIANAIDEEIFGEVRFDPSGQVILSSTSNNRYKESQLSETGVTRIMREKVDAIAPHIHQHAKFLRDDEGAVSLLVDVIRTCSGKGHDRINAAVQVKNLREALGVPVSVYPDWTLLRWFNRILVDAKRRRISKHVPALLLWLALYHQKEAASFYHESGLSKQMPREMWAMIVLDRPN